MTDASQVVQLYFTHEVLEETLSEPLLYLARLLITLCSPKLGSSRIDIRKKEIQSDAGTRATPTVHALLAK